jgi:hypothetical protein
MQATLSPLSPLSLTDLDAALARAAEGLSLAHAIRQSLERLAAPAVPGRLWRPTSRFAA